MKLNYIDFRKELYLLRDNMGFRWVALRSVDLSKPCNECKAKVPDNYDQSFARCKACLGIGYLYIDKLVKGYRYSQRAFPGIRDSGAITISENRYIFQHDSNPKVVDWVLELELNEETLIPVQPFKITAAYKIKDVSIFRGDNGRIDFFVCSIEEQKITLGRSQ